MGGVTVMMEVLVVFGSLDIAFFFMACGATLRFVLKVKDSIFGCVCVCVEWGWGGGGYQEVSSDWSM